MSWWVGLDRAAFQQRIADEQDRLRRMGLNPTANDMAQHRRTRRQKEMEVSE